MAELLVIGLDGASFDLLGDWIQNGELPYFKELLSNGVKGELQTIIPPQTPAVIPSFCSGKNPGEIGISGFTKGQHLITSKDLPRNTIWEILSRNGFRSAIINVPLTYPPQEVNGCMISDSRYIPSAESNYTYPPQLRDLTYDYPIGNPGGHPERFVDRKGHFNAPAVLETLTQDMKTRFEIAKRILDKDNVDFLLLYVIETDTIHHFIRTREKHVLSLYKEIDSSIKELVEKSNCRNVIIFSDHGSEKYPDFYFNTNTWLRKEGFLKLKERSPYESIVSAIYRLSGRINIFRKIGYSIGKKMFMDQQLGTRPPGIDWKSTIAFAQSYGITIFQQNIPEEESYDSIRDTIIRKMREIDDPDRQKAIGKIYRREELYWGDKLAEFPDIMFLTRGFFPNVVVYPHKVFERMSEKERKNREGAILEGTHLTSLGSDALFIASGEDFESGKEVTNTRIYDIAPTILHMFDIPVPKDMDGRVLTAILREDSEAAQRQVRYQEADAEQERVKSRIQKLKESGKL